MDLDLKAKSLDRETLKHFLAMTIAGRLKRSIASQALDPLFKTTAFKQKFRKLTKGNKKTAEWLLYAAGAAVNVLIPEDTPIRRMANEILSDTLAEGGRRVAEMPSPMIVGGEHEKNEKNSVLEKTLEADEAQLKDLLNWLDSLDDEEGRRFFEEVRTLSAVKLTNFLGLDNQLRTKLLNLAVPPAPEKKNFIRQTASCEARELARSLKCFNQRLADKRQTIRTQRQDRRERRVRQ